MQATTDDGQVIVTTRNSERPENNGREVIHRHRYADGFDGKGAFHEFKSCDRYRVPVDLALTLARERVCVEIEGADDELAAAFHNAQEG